MTVKVNNVDKTQVLNSLSTENNYLTVTNNSDIDLLTIKDSYLDNTSANTIVRSYIDGNGSYSEMISNVRNEDKNSDYSKRINFDGATDSCYIDTHLGKTSSIYTAITGDQSNFNINVLGNNASLGLSLNGDNSYLRAVLDGYSIINFYASGDDTNKSLNYCYLSSGYNNDDGIGANNTPLLFFKKGGTANDNKYGLGFNTETHDLGYITKEDNTINWHELDFVPRLSTDGNKVYAHSGSNQLELDYDINATGESIAQRTSAGNIIVGSANLDTEALNLKRADDFYLRKNTNDEAAVYYHVGEAQGTAPYTALPTPNTIVFRAYDGNFCSATPVYNEHVTNKSYVDSNFVPQTRKINGTPLTQDITISKGYSFYLSAALTQEQGYDISGHWETTLYFADGTYSTRNISIPGTSTASNVVAVNIIPHLSTSTQIGVATNVSSGYVFTSDSGIMSSFNAIPKDTTTSSISFMLLSDFSVDISFEQDA